MSVVLLIMFFGHSVLTEPVRVTAYEGETVTLHSRGNTAWNLDSIRWTIWKNKTFIATYNSDPRHLKTDLFWSYMGRLNLSTTTGDLQIKNVIKEDAKLYSVRLEDNNGEQHNHKVQLNVRAQLPNPILNLTLSAISNDRCMVELHCTSPQEELNISWAYIGNPSVLFAYRHLDKNNSVLWANLPADIPTNFSCTISDDIRNSSISKQPSCKVTPSRDIGRHHYIILSPVAFLCGLLVCWALLKWMPIRKQEQQEETTTVTPAEQQEETPTVTPAEQQEETTTETPAEQQEETPTETPAEQQEETTTETPAEQQEETPTETPAEQQEETPKETPAEQQEETPTVTPAEQQEETPTETPAEQQEETPTVTPAEQQEETPTETPAEQQEETPTETPAEQQEETPTVTPEEQQEETPEETSFVPS
ncbi:putative uncharacterized protein DDB_G0290521 [Sardina pilchardus]|uniref:putative uncharacterized protein DDB_G0290521 n=1 Tax=Sardina pilchardus TaxID=27697 RepID=UPI002E115BF9